MTIKTGKDDNRFWLIVFVALSMTIFSFGSSRAEADIFYGLKYGQIDSGVANMSNPENLVFNLGYLLDTLHVDLSLVAEFSRSISDGKSASGDHLEAQSNGLYLVFKSDDTIYFTLRGGYMEQELRADMISKNQQGFSFSGGVGLVIGKTRWLLEYMEMLDDASAIMLGVEFY